MRVYFLIGTLFLFSLGCDAVEGGSDSDSSGDSETTTSTSDTASELPGTDSSSDTGSDSETVDCVALSDDEDACAAESSCVGLVARRMDLVNTCLLEIEFVACQSVQLECGFAEISVEDPNGDCWLMPSTCMPAEPGWENGGPGSENDCAWLFGYRLCE